MLIHYQLLGRTDESGADSDIEDDTPSLPSSVNEKRSVSSPEPEADDFGIIRLNSRLRWFHKILKKSFLEVFKINSKEKYCNFL